MKFLNIALANGAISEDSLKTTRADPISVPLNNMIPNGQENFLRKLQDTSAGTESSERVIFTCADDAGCADSGVGKNCVDGFCVADDCKDIKYNGVDPNPEACYLWKFPNDTQGFYKRTTVLREFADNLPTDCLFFRFHKCSEEDELYRTNPRNCEYDLEPWGACDNWETAEGQEIGYARNRAVKDAPKDNPKNANGQTCWTAGSVPAPINSSGQVAIEVGDQFWRNKLDGHCMAENMVKPVAEGGCGLTFGEWAPFTCKKYTGFGDVFPADQLTDGKIFAQIRGHQIEAAPDTVLKTGEKCETYDETRRNIVRQAGQGVQACDDPATVCPKQSDDAFAYQKEGCCEYEFSDFGECVGGKKIKTIKSLLRFGSGVPCYGEKAITGNKLNTEEGIKALGWESKEEWKGSLWEMC